MVWTSLLLLAGSTGCDQTENEPVTLNLPTDHLHFWAEGGTNSFEVESNVDWHVASESDWVSTKRNGDLLSIQAEPNSGVVERTTLVKVTGQGLFREIRVTQDPRDKEMTLLERETTFPFIGGEREFYVQTNTSGDWEVTTDASWLQIETDQANRRIDIIVERNDSRDPRVARLTFRSGDTVFGESYTVTQEGIPVYYLPFTAWGGRSEELTRYEEGRGNTVIRIPDFLFTHNWGFKTPSPYFDYFEYRIESDGHFYSGWLYSSKDYAEQVVLPSEIAKMEAFFIENGFRKEVQPEGTVAYINRELKTKAVFQKTHSEYIRETPRIYFEYYIEQEESYPTFTEEELFGVLKDFNGKNIYSPAEDEYEKKVGGTFESVFSDSEKRYYSREGEALFRIYFLGQTTAYKNAIRTVVSGYKNINRAFFIDDIGQQHITNEFHQLMVDNGFSLVQNKGVNDSREYLNLKRKLSVRIYYAANNYTNGQKRLLVQFQLTN